MQVLDSSAFIHEYTTDEDVVSIPAVHEELTGEVALRFDAMEGSGMTVHVPAPEAVDRVRRAAKGSGDAAELSDTDVRLIATALELHATLVSDDYAMQNVAERLDLPVEPLCDVLHRVVVADERRVKPQGGRNEPDVGVRQLRGVARGGRPAPPGRQGLGRG
ncbi:NOB1 family endonuclease, partial [Halorubrum sp. ASP1]|uniref:NOB1 family endonuclease n=1 Tax=Halorubrum sp. ASP1 TaxID=2518114 RepID=UPI001F5469D8